MKLRSVPKRISDWFWNLLPEDILLAGVFVVLTLYLSYIVPIVAASHVSHCAGHLWGIAIGCLATACYIGIRKMKGRFVSLKRKA